MCLISVLIFFSYETFIKRLTYTISRLFTTCSRSYLYLLGYIFLCNESSCFSRFAFLRINEQTSIRNKSILLPRCFSTSRQPSTMHMRTDFKQRGRLDENENFRLKFASPWRRSARVRRFIWDLILEALFAYTPVQSTRKIRRDKTSFRWYDWNNIFEV